MFLKYTFLAILTTGCLILNQFKHTKLGQQCAFFGSVKTKSFYTSSDLQGDVWCWQHYRHSESRSWPHKEPWPQWHGNSLLSLESMLSLALGEPMLYHCWQEAEPPGNLDIVSVGATQPRRVWPTVSSSKRIRWNWQLIIGPGEAVCSKHSWGDRWEPNWHLAFSFASTRG